MILGSLVAIMNMYYWILISDIHKNGIATVGKIVSYESDSDGHKAPVIKFICKNGMHILTKPFYYASTDFSKIRSYKNNIDSPIDIFYNPKYPERFIIEKEKHFNSFSLIFTTLVGLIFLTFGICNIIGFITFEF
ncbi:DUF3592 domain-containing protein [Flavobacterium sp. SM2513]|uniref:DUF3592 domain-containing protein n=1 Tax=Flavobacterium sp. SM2513 TaxID=3424766 RepID=UPI003D7F6787